MPGPRSHLDNLFLAFRSDPIWSPLLTHRVKLTRDANQDLPKNESGNLTAIYHTIGILLKAGFRYRFPENDDTFEPILDTSMVINLRSYGNLLKAIENNPNGDWIIIPE